MTTDNGSNTTGRDPNTGMFRPGHTLSRGNNGGNPNVRRQAEYKRALISCGSEEDIQKLYATLTKAALDGDIPAAKLLLDHLVGRPVQSVELSGPDNEPARVELSTLVAVIMSAVGDDMQARVKIASALRQHRLSQEGNGDGPAADA
jgi:hypothetical protein